MIFCGNLRCVGNAWRDEDGFNYEITAITFDDANVFGLYEFDHHMRNGFSTDVHKAVLSHCEWLFDVNALKD
jgi:hypothetical protein